MARRPRIGRQHTVVVQIGRVRQEIEERVGLRGSGGQHDSPDWQRQHHDPQERGPFVAPKCQSACKKRHPRDGGNARDGPPERLGPEHAPEGQHECEPAPAGDRLDLDRATPKRERPAPQQQDHPRRPNRGEIDEIG